MTVRHIYLLLLIFQNYELIFTDGKFEVIQRNPGGEVPYTIRYMGIYMVIDTTSGLVLMWDKKTSMFIKLSPEYEVSGRRFGIGF